MEVKFPELPDNQPGAITGNHSDPGSIGTTSFSLLRLYRRD